MEIKKNSAQVVVAIMMFGFTALVSAPLSAETIVNKGHYDIDTVDGGGRECRIKDVPVPCGIGVFEVIPDLLGVNPWTATFPVPGLWTPLEPIPYTAIRTLSNSSTKVIGAAYSNAGTANAVLSNVNLGVPNYATSWLYNDIKIEASNDVVIDDVVNAQISVTYDWEGGVLGTFNYEGRIALSIEVEDITLPTVPKGIGSFDLVARDRSGDQGFTDIAIGGTAYDRNNDTNHFLIQLERGKTYRIYFKAEAYGAPLLSSVESSIRARLTTMGITIQNDSNEKVITAINDLSDKVDAHDQDIKQDISTLSYRLDTHDEEIKAQLLAIKSDLAEIKRMLITPQGRRVDFPLK